MGYKYIYMDGWLQCIILDVITVPINVPPVRVQAAAAKMWALFVMACPWCSASSIHLLLSKHDRCVHQPG